MSQDTESNVPTGLDNSTNVSVVMEKENNMLSQSA